MLTVPHALRYVFGGWLGGVTATLLALSIVLVVAGGGSVVAVSAASISTVVLAVIVFGGLYRIHRRGTTGRA